jgi:hypothetical protein
MQGTEDGQILCIATCLLSLEWYLQLGHEHFHSLSSLLFINRHICLYIIQAIGSERKETKKRVHDLSLVFVFLFIVY